MKTQKHNFLTKLFAKLFYSQKQSSLQITQNQVSTEANLMETMTSKNILRTLTGSFTSVFSLIMLFMLMGASMPILAKPAINLDQCANGAVFTPRTQCRGSNGNTQNGFDSNGNPVSGLAGWKMAT